MHSIKTKFGRRKFTHSDAVGYSLQNEVLLLRISEEIICFSFQHVTYVSYFFTDLVAYCTKVMLFFVHKKVHKKCFDDAFVEKRKSHTRSFFLFSESYCLPLPFWLIRQTGQTYDEGRIFCYISE